MLHCCTKRHSSEGYRLDGSSGSSWSNPPHVQFFLIRTLSCILYPQLYSVLEEKVIATIYLTQVSLKMSSKSVSEHFSFKKKNAVFTSISSARRIRATSAEVEHRGKAASAARGHRGRSPGTHLPPHCAKRPPK